MEIVLLIIRLILFGVFAVAGISKLLDPKGSAKAMREFGTPEEFSKFFAYALPFAEIVFAICLLFTSMSWLGAVGALILLLSFIGGMIWQIAQGRAPDCHCFGQIHSEPVGKKSLIRNIVFALLALVLIGFGRSNQGLDLSNTSSEMLEILLILFLVVLGIVLLGYLIKLTDQQNEIVRRLGLLEFATGDVDPVTRNEAGDPSDGLPIGAPLPDFAIPDLGGKIVHFDHLLAGKKPFLFLFVGPQCAPCEELLPEMREWEGRLSDKLKFVFISHGEINPNKVKFGDAARTVLVEPKRDFAESVNAKWTPTALFVDADGNIASHIAAGDIAIRRLVEQIRTRDLNEDFIYFLGLNGHRRPNIGQAVAEFEVEDIEGRKITEKDLAGRTTLVAFSSPTCGHCAKLMGQIRAWESSQTPQDPRLIIFTDGKADEERKLGLRSPIIVDAGYKTAAKFGMRGVASAVLVNEKGIIVTEAAIGPDNIWALIGGR
ncbi:MAG: redoxin domain-containing protein [Acidobacteria bacterium]|nr:redoxin domain-containing protein [Acidobacteriota bacterium]